MTKTQIRRANYSKIRFSARYRDIVKSKIQKKTKKSPYRSRHDIIISCEIPPFSVTVNGIFGFFMVFFINIFESDFSKNFEIIRGTSEAHKRNDQAILLVITRSIY